MQTMGTSAVGEVVDAVVEPIAEAPASGEGVGHGFGIFGARRGPARTGRVPRSGERVEISESMAPTFRAGKPLRDAVRVAAAAGA